MGAQTCCGVASRDLSRSLATLGEIERVKRKELLVRGGRIRVGRRGRVDKVHGILLHGTREPGDTDRGQVGSGQFSSRALDGEVVAVKPLSNQGSKGGYFKAHYEGGI